MWCLSEKKQEMSHFFEMRGYPTNVIEAASTKTENLTQQQLLLPKHQVHTDPVIPFVTTYHPEVKRVFKVLHDNWHILDQDHKEDGIFKGGPILSMRKGKSLKDILVRNKIDNPTAIKVGTYPCHRSKGPKCVTCEYTTNQAIVQGPAGSCNITKAYSCTTKNVVYAVTCTTCSKVYVGETGRRLGDRFREHRRDVLNRSQTSPVAMHFNETGHNVDGISVCVLRECYTERERKRLEMRLINYMGTRHPNGINLEFTFNV